MAKLSVRPKNNVHIIELVNLVKQFGDKVVLQDLNLKINKGEFVTILGASGSGKTTALRLIGGFEWPTRGEIKFYGVDVKDLPAYRRPTNTIFQDYALFPHLTVAGNVKYGLKLIKVPKNDLSYLKLQKQKYDLKLAQPEIKVDKKKNLHLKIKNLEQKEKNLIKKINFEQESKKIELARKEKEWEKIAKQKMLKLDREQDEYAQILNKARRKSTKYKKARKWMDNSDFNYSYWETFVTQKKAAFERRYMMRKLRSNEINEKVNNALELVGLENSNNKTIDELSGGMKQRVALARAIVTKPQILLLDEPLSALDLKVRQKMQRELKAIQRELGLTFIFVTHDQEEAMTISDRIAIMRDGKIEQFDKPQIIYEFPANSWVANFIGESNIFKAEVIRKNQIFAFNQKLPGDTYQFKVGQDVQVMIRPEDITLTKGRGFIMGKITNAIFQGTFWEYNIKTLKVNWRARTTKAYKIGEEIALKWTASDVHTMVN